MAIRANIPKINVIADIPKDLTREIIVVDNNSSDKTAEIANKAGAKVLFEKNSNDLMKPASMAKIMTAYIVFDRLQEGSLSLDDRFVVSKNAWQKGGSRTFLKLNLSLIHI